MADNDTGTGFRETTELGRDAARSRDRVDDALKAARGRRKARRSRQRALLESVHHRSELREKV